MQQRQLRLGDILDDYCPRERRVTNHAVVAMVGSDVKQTRCTTCDAEHEYKHARVPRQRRKPETPAALLAQAAAAPKRVPHDAEAQSDAPETHAAVDEPALQEEADLAADAAAAPDADAGLEGEDEEREPGGDEEGPVHRPLIRATLPRIGGQPPPPRPAPEFTIRQPGGRQNRFRARHQRGAQPFGNRSNGNQGGGVRRGGWPPHDDRGAPRPQRRHGHKRSK